MRDDPDTGSNNAGQCYEGCPPQISDEFLNELIQELELEYCEHDDSAVQIAEYIVQEIKTNTRSKEANNIKNLLVKGRNRRLSSVSPLIQFSNSTSIPYIEFFDMVATGKPWDHKPIIMKKFKDQGVERPNGFDGIRGKISKTFYTKYKDYDYFYDVWSNIHYGYIGKSIGFTTEELINGSNIQQFGHDLLKLEMNFGDTVQDILDALDSNEHLQANLDQESKQTHWCWHSKNKSPKKKRNK